MPRRAARCPAKPESGTAKLGRAGSPARYGSPLRASPSPLFARSSGVSRSAKGCRRCWWMTMATRPVEGPSSRVSVPTPPPRVEPCNRSAARLQPRSAQDRQRAASANAGGVAVPNELPAAAEAPYPRGAGKSASRARCSWHSQSRSLVTEHPFPSAADGALPLHAYTSHASVVTGFVAKEWRAAPRRRPLLFAHCDHPDGRARTIAPESEGPADAGEKQ